MTRTQPLFIALAALLIVGCTTGGREYWLYPEPRLTPPEEAIFVAYESHGIVSIDGAEAASRCWGQTVDKPQGYRPKDVLCRLHLRPGRHTVVFRGRLDVLERNRVEFTAEPGKAYGLNWSDCVTIAGGYQQTCAVNVVELKESAGVRG